MRDLIVSNKQLPSIKDGVLKGIEIASGAKSSGTYYHKKEDQAVAVRNAIANLYLLSKELHCFSPTRREPPVSSFRRSYSMS
jgi:hypothetical protein